MSETRYPGLLSWSETRRVAAVLRAARLARPGFRQQDVAEALGWGTGKVHMAEHAITRMSAADALAFAGAVGVAAEDLGLEAAP